MKSSSKKIIFSSLCIFFLLATAFCESKVDRATRLMVQYLKPQIIKDELYDALSELNEDELEEMKAKVAKELGGALFSDMIYEALNEALYRCGQPQVVVPISNEYTIQREILDWYTSLGAIRTKTSDKVPASVVVDIALGYKKDDKIASAEITQRKIELKDFLRRYFTEKTVVQLRPQNENNLKIELKNAINNEILKSSKIKDISFLQLDVVE